jgi:putative transposase
MLIKQAYRFEILRPTGEQIRNMRRFAGTRRYIFNHALALNNEMYSLAGKRHTRYQLDKLITAWKKETPWLSDAPAQTLQQVLVDLERAYTNFREGRAKFPTFKKKGQRDSFRYPQGFKMDNANGRIELPKLGWLRYRKSQDVEGTPKNVTVSESCGHWFVSIQTEREVETPVHASSSEVALDMGVAIFATLSTGNTIMLPHTKRLEERKKFLQRRLKNKTKFSSNWRELQTRVKKIDRRIANIRGNHRHQFRNTITKNHGVVYGDDLSIKNMTKSARGTIDAPGKSVKQKSGLNRSILAQGIGEVNRQLEYKAAWRGGIYIPCPPRCGSQRCPCCEHISKDNRKTQELFLCIKCGFSGNADFVATLNKLEAGRALIACGEFPSWTRFVSGTNSVKQEPAEATQAQSA